MDKTNQRNTFDINAFVNRFSDNSDSVENNSFSDLKINSEYYDHDSIMTGLNESRTFQTKVMHLNIRSLPAKFEALKLFLHAMSETGLVFDVIMICESFLHDNNARQYSIPGYNFVYKNRKHTRGGGVCMYIQNNIQYIMRSDLSLFHEGEFESIFIETLGSKSNSSIIGEIYRVPNTNVLASLKHYDTLINKLEQNKTVIIGTDQNLDFLKIDSDKNITQLLNAYISSSLIPTITRPTRITHTTATLIDNIFLKHNTNFDIHSGIIISDISDHMPIFCFYGNSSPAKNNPNH